MHADKALRARSLAMMRAPRQWPCYPFLPLTRPVGDDFPELGVMYDARGRSGKRGYSCTVLRACLLLLPPTEEQLLALPSYDYDTLEQLLEDGWRVD